MREYSASNGPSDPYNSLSFHLNVPISTFFESSESRISIPAQDVPFALIIWYVSKIIYSLWESDQFSINVLSLFFDPIAMIVHAFIVMYQYYTINYIYINVTKSTFF